MIVRGKCRSLGIIAFHYMYQNSERNLIALEIFLLSDNFQKFGVNHLYISSVNFKRIKSIIDNVAI